MRHIVLNAERKTIFRRIIVYRDQIGWIRVLRTESIASAKDWHILEFTVSQCGGHIKEQRLPLCSRLFTPVQHLNALNRIRQRLYKMSGAKRTEQAHLDKPDLFAPRCQVINRLLCSVTHGAHRHNNFLCVRRTIVVKQFIIRSHLLVYFPHIRFHNCWQTVIVRICRLSHLEENIRILRRAPLHRTVRI